MGFTFEKNRIQESDGEQKYAYVSNARVLVDKYHQKLLGLSVLENNCAVIEDCNSEQLFGEEYSSDAIIDSRPEHLSKFITNFLANRNKGQISCVIPNPNVPPFLQHIVESNLAEEIIFENVEVLGSCSVFRIAAGSDSSGVPSSYIKGFLDGFRNVEITEEVVKSLENEKDTLLRQLLQALMEIQQHLKRESERANLSAEDRKTTYDYSKEYFDMKSKYSYLVKKYDALAKSRLGRLTLWRWNGITKQKNKRIRRLISARDSK